MTRARDQPLRLRLRGQARARYRLLVRPDPGRPRGTADIRHRRRRPDDPSPERAAARTGHRAPGRNRPRRRHEAAARSGRTRRAPREPGIAIPLTPSRLAPLDVDGDGEPVETPPSPLDSPRRAPPPGTTVGGPNRFLRGTITHALLQHLPTFAPDRWERAAARFRQRAGRRPPRARPREHRQGDAGGAPRSDLCRRLWARVARRGRDRRRDPAAGRQRGVAAHRRPDRSAGRRSAAAS